MEKSYEFFNHAQMHEYKATCLSFSIILIYFILIFLNSLILIQ